MLSALDRLSSFSRLLEPAEIDPLRSLLRCVQACADRLVVGKEAQRTADELAAQHQRCSDALLAAALNGDWVVVRLIYKGCCSTGSSMADIRFCALVKSNLQQIFPPRCDSCVPRLAKCRGLGPSSLGDMAAVDRRRRRAFGPRARGWGGTRGCWSAKRAFCPQRGLGWVGRSTRMLGTRARAGCAAPISGLSLGRQGKQTHLGTHPPLRGISPRLAGG